MQITLLSWLVLELTDSPWLVALVGFFGMAPLLFLGPFGGVLADRLNRQRAVSPTLAIGLNASMGMVLIALVWLLMPALRQPILPRERG